MRFVLNKNGKDIYIGTSKFGNPCVCWIKAGEDVSNKTCHDLSRDILGPYITEEQIVEWVKTRVE